MSSNVVNAQKTPTLSMPRLFLHLDGAAMLAGALLLYANLQFSWSIFALLLLVPDLALIGYVIDKRAASILYNLAHSLVFPVVLGLLSYLNGYFLGIQLALIWLVHIGMDHAFGFGLKYLGSAKDTHFSRI